MHSASVEDKATHTSGSASTEEPKLKGRWPAQQHRGCSRKNWLSELSPHPQAGSSPALPRGRAGAGTIHPPSPTLPVFLPPTSPHSPPPWGRALRKPQSTPVLSAQGSVLGDSGSFSGQKMHGVKAGGQRTVHLALQQGGQQPPTSKGSRSGNSPALTAVIHLFPQARREGKGER